MSELRQKSEYRGKKDQNLKKSGFRLKKKKKSEFWNKTELSLKKKVEIKKENLSLNKKKKKSEFFNKIWV